MVDFSHIPKLMRQLKCSHLRIFDSTDTLIYIINDTKVEPAIKELEAQKDWLSTYSRISIKACTEKQFHVQFKGGYEWDITFDRPAQGVSGSPLQIGAAANNQILELNRKLLELEFKHKLDKAEREYEEKLTGKGGIGEWMPVINKFLGKMFPENAGEITEAINPRSTMAGGKKTKLSQTTETELKESVDESNELVGNLYALIDDPAKFDSLMSELHELTEVVEIDTVIKLITKLKKKPELATIALTLP